MCDMTEMLIQNVDFVKLLRLEFCLLKPEVQNTINNVDLK